MSVSKKLKHSCRLLLIRMPLLLLGAISLAGTAKGQEVLNLEICYMIKSGANAHTHRPSTAELAAVIEMFACHGITLNVVVTTSFPEVAVMPVNPSNGNDFFDFDNGSTSYAYLKNTYFVHADDAGWHHCIFGHQYAAADGTPSGSSGLGETPGDDFVVTLGTFADQIGTEFDRAATLAHEFGHNLGLVHGAAGAFQPNKPSIMSYTYQLGGVRTRLICSGLSTEDASLFKDLDYSQGTMCSLDEAALNETIGTRMAAVNWNCDSEISGTVTNIIDTKGFWCPVTGGSPQTLPDVNEWLVLTDAAKTNTPEQLTKMPVSVGITSDQARAVAGAFFCGQPMPAVETCTASRMIYIELLNLPNPNGNCSSPYNTPGQAQLSIPDGSNLFLFPGSYHEGGPVTYSKPMKILSNVGPATIAP